MQLDRYMRMCLVLFMRKTEKVKLGELYPYYLTINGPCTKMGVFSRETKLTQLLVIRRETREIEQNSYHCSEYSNQVVYSKFKAPRKSQGVYSLPVVLIKKPYFYKNSRFWTSNFDISVPLTLSSMVAYKHEDRKEKEIEWTPFHAFFFSK